MHRPLAILVAGDPVPPARALRGGFDEFVRAAAGTAWRGCWAVADARNGELPDPTEVAGVVITGSPASLTEPEPWMDHAGTWVRTVVDSGLPTLGICFGHQLLGHALGGRVARNPRGRELGTVRAAVTAADPLLPAVGSSFEVQTTHLDSVVELPPGATVLASTALEPHAALRFREHVWGVQFHPEFDAAVLRCYVNDRRDELAADGVDVGTLLTAIRDTPAARAVLERFCLLVASLRG